MKTDRFLGLSIYRVIFCFFKVVDRAETINAKFILVLLYVELGFTSCLQDNGSFIPSMETKNSGDTQQSERMRS
jgi:hypothetical protein